MLGSMSNIWVFTHSSTLLSMVVSLAVHMSPCVVLSVVAVSLERGGVVGGTRRSFLHDCTFPRAGCHPLVPH